MRMEIVSRLIFTMFSQGNFVNSLDLSIPIEPVELFKCIEFDMIFIGYNTIFILCSNSIWEFFYLLRLY